MENRNGSMTNLDAVMQLLEGRASRLMFMELYYKLLKREVYVEDIFQEYTPEYWNLVNEAMEATNTETSLRIGQAIQNHLEHKN